MRINVLQHTPNEGPGTIQQWSQERGHEMYIYHPYQFGNLPTANKTDMLIVLGGPMSPNDNLGWIKKERVLIHQLLDEHKPIFGVCYGAQQIAKTLGCAVKKAPHKEVGWASVYLKSSIISGIPKKLTALHWHEEMFEVPDQAELLFSSDLVKNQGFIMNDNVIGLQFHFEPAADNVREIAANDTQYPLQNNDLHQTGEEIIHHRVPSENKRVMAQLLDFIANN
ncbi:type 1 glutamine amidotransferase [Limosilactobacillus fastidiosus]|uniref:Type 1 glutamine amidotransferase n=1 Tax=Limosilactobacillus fastidiosus TaxID=2759855 RepID=A0A7W3TYE1_9LACO|nr:type 1 glutamine amidotransferase [Limosilactobacillus fastidiosus]MBB1085507.1 type 1 glutamine amidotransferase [Limosilactobacillus fastidiosus]MCD7085960.1 type 1 glutamine amidotransferase [Limosilactobacillus fastidiosus]MCD7114396.1 type 1 glutamine amidotransferase [Limosilactobacillus fastidiosus]MCD7116403.1 type 1 glutamine amidotransferase [Limosilactobacillus fastidiosus]